MPNDNDLDNPVITGEDAEKLTRPPRRRTNRRETISADDVIGATETADIAEGIDAKDIKSIEDVLAGLGQDGGSVRLERKGPTDTHFQYICKYPAQEFDIDVIKATYGGGSYKCSTFRSNGQIYKPFTFSIDHRLKGSIDVPSSSKDSGFDGASRVIDMASRLGKGNGDSATLPLILKMIDSGNANNSQMMVMMMQMQEQGRQAQQASSDRMIALIGALAPVLAPLFSRTPAPDHTAKLLEIVMTNKPQSPVANMQETIELIKAAGELNGGGASKDSSLWERILTAVSPAAGPLASAIMQRVSPQQTPPTNIQIVPAPQISEAGEPAPEPQLDMIMALKVMLLQAAVKGCDPLPYADVVMDFVGDSGIEPLHSALTQENWRALLFGDETDKTNVEIAKHAEWFDKLRQHILDSLNDEPISHHSGQPAESKVGVGGDTSFDGVNMRPAGE